MPKPPPFTKNRPGSSVPAGRNFKGNRFAGLETAAEEKAEGKKAPPPFKKKGKAKGKKRPSLPPQAMGLANMMAAAGKKK